MTAINCVWGTQLNEIIKIRAQGRSAKDKQVNMFAYMDIELPEHYRTYPHQGETKKQRKQKELYEKYKGVM